MLLLESQNNDKPNDDKPMCPRCRGAMMSLAELYSGRQDRSLAPQPNAAAILEPAQEASTWGVWFNSYSSDFISKLVVNPNMVARACQDLEREQVVETGRGPGAYICEPWTRRSERESRSMPMRRQAPAADP